MVASGLSHCGQRMLTARSITTNVAMQSAAMVTAKTMDPGVDTWTTQSPAIYTATMTNA